jgi:NhaC family Na+:H+ antiporter
MPTDVEIALALAFTSLLVAISQGVFILYPLLGALGLLLLVYWRRGIPWSTLLSLMMQGVKQSSGVLSILLLIGGVVASWLVAGTVPALVYYGLHVIHPHWFLLSAFGLTALVSVLLGTSFGTVGTIGLALMIMARGAGVDEHWTAGAIIAGAYVGDLCSPMSSSAHLVATITQTDIYQDLRQMITTQWGALVLSLLVYGIASNQQSLPTLENSLLKSISATFVVSPLMLLPAGILVMLTGLRLPVRRILTVSLGCAIAIALSLQQQSPITVLQTLVWGLHLPATDPLSSIFTGGGLWAMGRVCLVVLVSTALAGLLAGMGTFVQLENWLERWSGDRGLFGSTLVASGLTSAFGCTQTIAILLTQQIAQPLYTRAQVKPEQLAIDLENSAVVLAPLVPWNIAGLVPATLLTTDAGFIPFAVYLCLLPLWNWVWRRSRHSPSFSKAASIYLP